MALCRKLKENFKDLKFEEWFHDSFFLNCENILYFYNVKIYLSKMSALFLKGQPRLSFEGFLTYEIIKYWTTWYRFPKLYNLYA